MITTTRAKRLAMGAAVGLAWALPASAGTAETGAQGSNAIIVAQAGPGEEKREQAREQKKQAREEKRDEARERKQQAREEKRDDARERKQAREEKRDEARERKQQAREEKRDDARERKQQAREEKRDDARERKQQAREEKREEKRDDARERAERERQERQKASQERAREQAERERDRERGQRERENDREKAQRERERNREQAERERDRERAQKERENDREKAQREQERNREQAERERERDRERAQRERERNREGRQEDRAERREDNQERAERRRQIREDRRGNIEQIRRERKERRENGRIIIEEPGNRRIIRDGNRTIIRHDDSDRFRRRAQNVEVERRNGERVTTVTRPDGTRIVTIEDDNGRLLRRLRRHRDGRDVVLIDNSRHYRGDRGHRHDHGGAAALSFFLDLAMPRVPIERHHYIVDADAASEDDLYDTLVAPPVVEIERDYSLDEIRYNYPLRARMRSVNLNTINFELGSWELDDQAYDQLDEVARAIKRALERNPDEVFLIEGHTDAVGGDEDNLTLSDRRAETVAIALGDEFMVPPENLTTQGYGEQYLLVETQQAERQNRRVTVRRITPLLSGGPRR